MFEYLFSRSWIFAFAAVAATAGCGKLYMNDQPCPCASGWTCCKNRNVCVKSGAACLDEPDGAATSTNAQGDAGACWSVAGTTQAGRVELGTGSVDFQPMPSSLAFGYVGQDALALPLMARIDGLSPGDPNNVFDPANPQTLFSATLADGTVVRGACPARLGYRAAQDGYHELGPYELPFLQHALEKRAVGTKVKLKVEVIDSQWRYTSDEKTVLLLPPPGSDDAGVSDDGAVRGDGGTRGDGADAADAAVPSYGDASSPL